MDKNPIFLQNEDDMISCQSSPCTTEKAKMQTRQSFQTNYPFFPLRNTVLFPGVVIPITVGRDKSLKAVNESYKTDKLVGVLAQKDSSVEDPALTTW